MPGPTPKPPDRRQRTNTHHGAVIPFRVGALVPTPPVPHGLLVATQKLWQSFWQSSLAQAVEPATDTPAIVRYFTLLDERQRAYNAYRKQRVVEGSQGQKVLNPMGRAMHDFDTEIRNLEDRLGLTPRARLQLGIQLGEAAKSLAQLNAVLEQDEDASEETDPR